MMVSSGHLDSNVGPLRVRRMRTVRRQLSSTNKNILMMATTGGRRKPQTRLACEALKRWIRVEPETLRGLHTTVAMQEAREISTCV